MQTYKEKIILDASEKFDKKSVRIEYPSSLPVMERPYLGDSALAILYSIS